MLPCAAGATLVLTATGAHLGGAAFGASAGAASAATATLTASGVATEDPIARDFADRAARDNSRSQASAVTAAETAAAGGGAGGTDAAPDGAADRLDTQAAADRAERTQAKVDAVALEKDKAAADAAAGAQVTADGETKAPADGEAASAAKAAADTAHAWVAPLNTTYQLTSGFGMRWGAMHPGQDFAISVGTPVKALSSGTVIFAGWEGGYGNKVEIQYWDGTVSWFAHNSQLLVSKGENVTPGETVSLSGNTGHSTGPHLHVEIHPNNGAPIPPIPWLTAKGIMP